MGQPPEEPHLGSFKLSRSLALGWGLYLLLALSALAGLLPSTRPDLVPAEVSAAAPVAFAAFLALFALYRFALVRARRYPAGRAFLQLGIGVLFLMLLVLGKPSPAKARTLESLMADEDPSVRAVACELARYREDGRRYARALVERLSDPEPRVREAAQASLRALAGRDVGAGEVDAIDRWRDWAAANGVAEP